MSAQGSDAIATLAAELDYDLERLVDFVADEIRYEPYVGLLRGATGTLKARAGNSVDQSVLLAALLDESLIPYRFARGRLEDATASDLLDLAELDVDGARASAARTLGGEEPSSLPPDPGPAALEATELAAIAEAADDELLRSGSRAANDVAMLIAALEDAGIVVPDAQVGLPQDERLAHTWLQVASGAEWLDVDPSLAVFGPGEVTTTADEHLDVLPDELRHRVRFEALVERVAGDGLVIEPALEYTAFADELAGRPLMFGHMRPSGLERLGVSISSLLGQADLAYHPMLQVPGGSIVADDTVSFGTSATEGGGGILEGSELFDETPADGTLPDGEASAEWLEVTIESPGQEPVTVTRTVFDRLGPADRIEGNTTADRLASVELVDLSGDGPAEFLPLLGLDTFAVVTGPTSIGSLLDLVGGQDANVPGALATAYLGLRDSLAATYGVDSGIHAYVDRPGVVGLSIDVEMANGEPILRLGPDLVHRSLGAIPLEDGQPSAAEANIIAGVVEHIAERATVQAGPPADGPVPGTMGVSRIFEAAQEAGVPIVVLQGDLPASHPYPAQAGVRIQAALQAGDVVVVPEEPVSLGGGERVGWWRVDPVTGRTADEMDDGTASQFVERLIVIAIRASACLTVFAPAIFTAMNAIFDGPGAAFAGLNAAGWTAFWIAKSNLVGPTVALCLTGA